MEEQSFDSDVTVFRDVDCEFLKGSGFMDGVNVSTRFLRSAGGVLSVVGLATLLALPATNALAQEATPVSANSYDPANCTTEPISVDHAAMLLATPVAAPELPVTDDGIVALPTGVPASEEEMAAVSATIEQLWACNNARDKGAVYALFTDQAIQESVGFTEGSSWDTAELEAAVALALVPGEPRTPDEWAAIDTIVSATSYDDGQVGVVIVNTDPLVADGQPVQDYFRFVIEDGVAKVSGIILDPFDLTPGYGFEKAA
jgi:hypothetical protein